MLKLSVEERSERQICHKRIHAEFEGFVNSPLPSSSEKGSAVLAKAHFLFQSLHLFKAAEFAFIVDLEAHCVLSMLCSKEGFGNMVENWP